MERRLLFSPCINRFSMTILINNSATMMNFQRDSIRPEPISHREKSEANLGSATC